MVLLHFLFNLLPLVVLADNGLLLLFLHMLQLCLRRHALVSVGFGLITAKSSPLLLGAFNGLNIMRYLVDQLDVILQVFLLKALVLFNKCLFCVAAVLVRLPLN